MALLAVILIAAWLRISSASFGLPALNDSDELMFELGAVRMLTKASINPGWFGHPATTTMYSLAILNASIFVFGWIAGWFANARDFANIIYDDPTWVILPGRLMMTAFALAGIALTYRLGERLFGARAGIIAAAIVAVSPVHITSSQIIRSDMQACLFMMLALLAIERTASTGRLRDTVWAAVWTGLAIATKWPFALVSFAMAGAVALRLIDGAPRLPEFRRLVGYGSLSLLVLIVASPYLIIDQDTVRQNLFGEARPFHLGATGGAPYWNAWWYVRYPLHQGLGAAVLLLSVYGMATLRQARSALAILVPVAAGFALILALQNLVWERWSLPLLQILALFAAAGSVRLWDRFAPQFGTVARRAMAALALTAIMAPSFAIAQSRAAERMNDTRQMASRWINANVAKGSTVLIEHFAFDLIDRPMRFLFPMGKEGCLDAVALLKGHIAYSKVESIRQSRSNIDIGTVAANQRRTCQANYAILTQFDRYAAEKARFPAEYASYAQIIQSGRIVATFSPVTGVAGGPIVRIVRIDQSIAFSDEAALPPSP